MNSNRDARWVFALGVGLMLVAPTAAQVRDFQAADGGELPNPLPASRLYVSASAQGANNGSSWGDAFVSLQDALELAESPGSTIQEIWVARGTYKPSPPGGDRAVSFRLVGGVSVYGGFAGGESMLDQRDPSANVTILSGDLNGEDGPGRENNGENSFHVVTWSSDLGPSVLDGFVVTGGHADGTGVWPNTHGGGGGVLMESGGGDFRLRNCTIRRNYAIYGGGVFAQPDAVIEDCLFEVNSAEEGGGLYASYNVEVKDCRFVSNAATNGGAIYSFSYLSQRLVNCAFLANSAVIGGAFYTDAYESEPFVVNCLLFGNHADVGGGIYRAGYNPRKPLHLVNSILWANTDENGSSERGQVYWEEPRALNAYDSCIQGWTGFIDGDGNFGIDPRFVDADGHDHEYGTPDDDLHLRADSPCINAGDNQAPFLPATDLDSVPRIQECRVDLGPYESPYFIDCNGNAASDACDIETGLSDDADGDGIPDDCEPITEPTTESASVIAPDSQLYQRFGTAVTVSADALAIGAPYHVDNDRDTGCVYVFRREGSKWVLSDLLRAADGTSGDRFGSSIALSGATMVIGAPRAYEEEFRPGAAYVFHRGPSGWRQITRLRPEDLAAGGTFGKCVAISKNEILVGAPTHNEQGQNAGCVYYFHFDGNEWRKTAKLLPSDATAGDEFGSCVAINGSSILVGSPKADVYGVDSGAAYLFDIKRALPNQSAKLIPPIGKPREHFGISVAISGDRLVIGTPSSAIAHGYAAVFQENEAGWLPITRLQASDRPLFDGFGYSVAFVGGDVVVGAPMGFGNTESSGCAYLFRFENEQWKEVTKLFVSDGAGYQRFGVSIAGFNDLILVGAEHFGMLEGKAYLFDSQSITMGRP